MQPSPPSRLPHGRLSTALRGLVVLLVVAPLSLLYMVGCLLLLPWRSLRIRAGNAYGKVVGRLILGMVGVKVRVSHRERLRASAPALYVCNHTSTIDMWAGMFLCPFGGCGVAKKEIVKVPFFGWAYLLSGHLLLDRGDRARAIASMEEAQEVVKKHHLSLWMWPEGTRSRDGRLQPMKKGFVHLAIATGLPVVPVVFHDADIMWPGHTFEIIPGDVRVDVLEPLDTTGWRLETADAHAHELWTRFQAVMGERQRGVAAAPPAEAQNA
ncbi:MAG: hypothetical protein CVU56_15080 [Deltaproteobacteria bacterium HGW-Deltaproteobacteria-14]|nr:MAG: hypothetical protein CVU56_15080 [Deltaproteobacteria bacterium HGW-Deltaproteobacteria-14]